MIYDCAGRQPGKRSRQVVDLSCADGQCRAIDQKLFYETTTQILWADKDGIGGSFAPVAVAILAQGSSAPTATDIFVV